MTPRKLTKRQQQILTLIQRGSSNTEIAKTLGVADNTVKVHVYRMFKALGVKNRSEAVYATMGAKDADAAIIDVLFNGLYNACHAIMPSVPANTPEEQKFHAYLRECSMFLQSRVAQEGA